MRGLQPHRPGALSVANGRLVLCPTPIGNLRDITLRALDELAAADLILAEDTRRTGLLLLHHGIHRPQLSYHEHNEEERLGEVSELLRAGRRLVHVTDAGTPAVADPGFRLVRAALDVGAEVTALPGPSAVLPALVLSGLPVHAFAFYGFLPRAAGARQQAVRDALSRPLTSVWYEVANRLPESLAAIVALGCGDRLAAVARELSKVHEEVARGSVAELRDRMAADAPRGEIVLLVGPAVTGGHAEDFASALAEVRRLRAAGTPLSGAVATVATAQGVSRRRLYRAALDDGGA